jgi:hypothetical protein
MEECCLSLLQTCNLLIPLASIGVINAIIRFGLEKTADKKGVFTIGCITLAGGFAVLLAFAPLLAQVEVLSAYIPYMDAIMMEKHQIEVVKQNIAKIDTLDQIERFNMSDIR